MSEKLVSIQKLLVVFYFHPLMTRAHFELAFFFKNSILKFLTKKGLDSQKLPDYAFILETSRLKMY